MTDGTDTMDTELTRRLTDAAATTTIDPGAWDRICERTEGGDATPPAPRRRFGPGPGLSPRGLLAIAAALALVVGIAAVALGRDGDHDRVRMSGEPTTEPPTTDSPQTTTATTTPTTAAPTQTTVPATTPTTAAATPACGPGCIDSATGDVDGDGRLDEVGLYGGPGTPAERSARSVRVVYATGEVEAVDLPPEFLTLHQLLGVTDLDGDGRAEIVYAYVPGAHSWFGGILGTGVTGKLHRVGFSEDVGLVDAALSVVAGFSCPDLDGDGHREFVTKAAMPDMAQSPITDMSVTTITYRWQGDRLVKSDEKTETAPYDEGRGMDAFAGASGGSHCPGLASPSEGGR